MNYNAATPEEYLELIPEERKQSFSKLRKVILDNLPIGFQETTGYGMIGCVVPHSIYPNGYHCDPKLPLPFLGIASQKNFIAFYHMGLYADEELSVWFINEFPKHSKLKLDMGKSCVRFKKTDQIPLDLIGELVRKMTVSDWIKLYEEKMKR